MATRLKPMPAGPTAHIPDPDPLPDYDPVTLHRKRHDGWTAGRQRTFLVALAETGCISEACRLAGITARSAYRLRAHPLGERFAAAWDQALRYATARLMTLAYERAIRGSVREHWRDGKLVAETRQPSDRLLIFLLGNLAPWNQADTTRWGRLHGMSGVAAHDLAPILDGLADCDVACDPLAAADFTADRPVDADTLVMPFDDDRGHEY